ncbi:bacterial low temperature requirement A protein-domain-containing protein [Gorgonomyces haynaldii]|nr:bacterial low temperature requirement A protein-domain-containing protein [Gorgonomyces haynaldii]
MSTECSMSCRFVVGNSIVVVVHSDQNLADGREKLTSSGKPIQYVVLGSQDHIAAVQSRLYELDAILATRQGDEKDKLSLEYEKRTTELQFLQDNYQQSTEEVLDDAFESVTTLEHSETTTEEEDVIHVSAETFGHLKKLKIIHVVEKRDRLLRAPKLRQYFIDQVLHREEHEHKTTWYELFVDLIYVGCIAKAGALLAPAYDTISLYQFVLVYAFIYQHWMAFTMYNNAYYHDDMFFRVFALFSTGSLVVMGVTLIHFFDDNPATNTSNIFIGALLISRIAYLIAYGIDMYFLPKFRKSILATAVARQLITAIFMVAILAIPLTPENLDLRMRLYAPAAVLPFILPTIIVPLVRNAKYRTAVNIEHMTERYGLLMVIVLGEIVLSFLFDHSSSKVNQNIGYTIVALMIATNIFYLYFRSETSPKHQHALRRHFITGVSWSTLHFPLSSAMIIVGVCLKSIVTASLEVKQTSKLVIRAGAAGYNNNTAVMFMSSMAVLLFCLGVLQKLHLDEAPTLSKTKRKYVPQVSQNIRIYVRLVIAILILILGLVVQADPATWLFVVLGLTTGDIIFEEVGRIKVRSFELVSHLSV